GRVRPDHVRRRPGTAGAGGGRGGREPRDGPDRARDLRARRRSVRRNGGDPMTTGPELLIDTLGGSPPPDDPPPATPTLAARRMARRLTTPFERGADTLELRLVPSTSSQAAVADYDFADHVARFDTVPEPRYVLATTRDTDVDTTVTVAYQEPGADPAHLDLVIPAGTVAGTSFALDKPVSATARLVLLEMKPTPLDNAPQECWTLTVMLGNMVKLMWVRGGERHQLRRH